MPARHSKFKRLAVESLESRQMLSVNGQVFTLTSNTGAMIDLSYHPLEGLTLAGDALDPNGDGLVVFDLAINDFAVKTESGQEFRGSVNLSDQGLFLVDGEAGGQVAASRSASLLRNGVAEAIRAAGGDASQLGRIEEAAFESITINSPDFGRVTIPSGQLYRPFAELNATQSEAGGSLVRLSVNLDSSASPFTTAGPASLRIDFGDGTVINHALPENRSLADVSLLSFTHEYAPDVATEYTITVTGVFPVSEAFGGGGVSLRPTCTTVRVVPPAKVTDTPGDDNITLRNENGRLIAAVNGVDEDLGASDEIVQVEVQLGRGNNTVDASGLLPEQSLFVPSIVNLDTETNTITGGPGDDVIFGGRGADLIFAGLGDDVITTNRGADEAHGGEGGDTFVIPGGFNFGTAFETELKELFGGEGFDTLQIADLQDRLQLVAPATPAPGFDGQFNFTKGVGSSAPQLHAFIKDWEALFIAPQSEQVFVNLANVDFLQTADVHGSPHNDSFNFTNSQIDVVAQLGDGDDDYLGGAGSDAVNGGLGDDELDGNNGDDTLSGGTGTNDLNGGAGDDRYSLFFSETGEEPTFDEITDTSGDNDAIGLIGFNQGASLDLNTGATQTIAPGVSVDLNLQTGRPIEDAAFQPLGDQPFSFNGTNADNTFSVVPLDFAFSGLGETPVVTIGDGLGGNDLVRAIQQGCQRRMAGVCRSYFAVP